MKKEFKVLHEKEFIDFNFFFKNFLSLFYFILFIFLYFLSFLFYLLPTSGESNIIQVWGKDNKDENHRR